MSNLAQTLRNLADAADAVQEKAENYKACIENVATKLAAALEYEGVTYAKIPEDLCDRVDLLVQTIADQRRAESQSLYTTINDELHALGASPTGESETLEKAVMRLRQRAMHMGRTGTADISRIILVDELQKLGATADVNESTADLVRLLREAAHDAGYAAAIKSKQVAVENVYTCLRHVAETNALDVELAGDWQNQLCTILDAIRSDVRAKARQELGGKILKSLDLDN